MYKKILSFFSVLVIFVFIGYMIYDTVRSGTSASETVVQASDTLIADSWEISDELKVDGPLKAVSVSSEGYVYLGGDSFVSCYDSVLNAVWNIVTPAPVTSLTSYGDTVFASTMDQILLIKGGEIINEWGPYDENCIITSVSANRSFVAFADAGNRIIFMLDKGGEVKKMVGQNNHEFVIPSAYFEVVLNNDDTYFVANTGHRRVEKRLASGQTESFFGEAGTAAGAFCGCCNPAHLDVIPGGFITAEKGINRIKILDQNGKFVEFVSAHNNFVPSVPLDIASADGKTIYAANPADSKLYIFTRKKNEILN